MLILYYKLQSFTYKLILTFIDNNESIIFNYICIIFENFNLRKYYFIPFFKFYFDKNAINLKFCQNMLRYAITVKRTEKKKKL